MPTDLITMQDPRSQYPGPPSEVEIQAAPASQAAMSEKPDCGERSYKGSGRLDGRKALLSYPFPFDVFAPLPNACALARRSRALFRREL
jgi:hypothetical protein